MIARETSDQLDEGIALNNLGEAYADLRDTHCAIAYLGEALVIFEAIESAHAAYVRATIANLNKEEGA